VIDRACPARMARVRVVSQRGANGIDGMIAGAAGAADASAAPTLLLVGDVSFAHDVGGLAATRGLRAPLAVVVIDNGGGRIFDALPVARYAAGARWYDEHFLTPPAVVPELAAAAYGLRGRAVDTANALSEATATALAEPGCTVIRAAVAPESAARSLARLQETISTAVAATLGEGST
jgi:2-succinyl-5-enolpyruvyl-6-hydroxy-3-cyclohexene-1-carboxylate synthase